MVSAIFQPEITNLQSQVAELQAQIERLSQAQFIADGAVEAVREAVRQVEGVAPTAIASLKSVLLGLFGNNGNQSNGGGNQPINPAPGSPLNGQSCPVDLDTYWKTAQPDGSSWEIATPLACQLEDGKSESIQGQSFELACLVGHSELCEGALLESPHGSCHGGNDDRVLPTHLVPVEEPAYIDLVQVNDCVAYMRRLDGEVIAVYAGGNNKQRLRNWGDWLSRSHSVTHGYELREAKRLNTRWELKLTPMTLAAIEKLAACDLSKDPRNAYLGAPVRKLEPSAPFSPRTNQIEDIGVGDTVRSITVKHWNYIVLAVRDDGFLDCERVGVVPKIQLALHPGSIELVAKAPTEEEKIAFASIQPPAYNPHPVGRRGAAANWKAVQERGGLSLKANGTGTTSMEEWRRIEAEQKQLAVSSATADDDF